MKINTITVSSKDAVPYMENTNALFKALWELTDLLPLESEIKKPKGQSKLQFEADKSVRKLGDTLASGIHGKIHEVEQDNSAVEAAHRSEILVESAARHYSHHRQSLRQISPSRRSPSWNTRLRSQISSSIMRKLSRSILR